MGCWGRWAGFETGQRSLNDPQPRKGGDTAGSPEQPLTRPLGAFLLSFRRYLADVLEVLKRPPDQQISAPPAAFRSPSVACNVWGFFMPASACCLRRNAGVPVAPTLSESLHISGVHNVVRTQIQRADDQLGDAAVRQLEGARQKAVMSSVALFHREKEGPKGVSQRSTRTFCPSLGYGIVRQRSCLRSIRSDRLNYVAQPSRAGVRRRAELAKA